LPWALGPPDGRYLIRRHGASPDAAPAHILVVSTLAARERRHVGPSRRQRKAQPEPEPTPVHTTRATIIDVGDPLPNPERAASWLKGAGEAELADGLTVLNRALLAHRVATADPRVHGVARSDALVARLGYGAGEQVADGQWTDARELVDPGPRRRRTRIPAAQARLAALLTGRERLLDCEELALRARLDLEEGRERAATLQGLIALDAALAELPADPAASALAERLEELRGLREGVAAAAQAALHGTLGDAERETTGSRRPSGRGRRRWRRSEAERAQQPLELRHHVAAHPHRGAAVERGRALGQNRDLAAGAQRGLGQPGHRIDLERGPDAQHQIGPGGERLRPRNGLDRQVLTEQHHAGLERRAAIAPGHPLRIVPEPAAHVFQFVP
jgi:hypothetical protein